jgi:aspartyl-tRNA(Asn)/glutamyl-tRNA(Gln) amidotransferase subunit A
VIPDPELLFTPIRELAAQIRSRRLSPVKLVEVSLRRLESYGPQLSAVVTLAGKQALDQAQDAEREIARGRYRGLLHGIPYGAKDLLATKDMPTTWGAEPYRNQSFDYDATVIRKLRDAGAILVAKLSMVELAGGMGYRNADASFNGPGINPWNPNYWSGGSSSGPGSAVGAGLVSFAIGSETVGSILTPSSFCGITGLRPTYGRVSRHGAMALCWTLDKLGPMGRSADDCAIVLAAVEGVDPEDPTTIQRLPRQTSPAQARLRIAVPKGVTNFVLPEVARNFNQSMEVLATLADVAFSVVLPDFPYGPVASTIVDAEGASAFFDLIESGGLRELRAETDRVGGYGGALVRAVDYLQAQRIREKMRKPFQELFQRYDVIAAPSRNTVALPLGIDFNQAYPELQGAPKDFVSPIGAMIQVGNLLGLPALALPNGFGRENLPTGLQLVSAPLKESTLTGLGIEYQKRTDFHRRRPPGF